MSWRRFFRRASWDRDRAEELRSYLEIETDENLARGMSPEAARRAAHVKLGNTVRIREEIYRMNTISPLDALGRDLRLALRGMRRRPGFTLAVVLTLALGIGANTAIFGVVDGVLIKPLSYPNAGELVSIKQVAPGLNVSELRMSATQYFTYRDEGRVFQQIGLYGDGGRTITGVGEPEQARALFVTYDVLQALGVKPQLGRIFTEADSAPGAAPFAPVILLTHAYWQRRFGGDRSVIGRRLIADSTPVEVIGVMPDGFRFLDMEPAAEVISLITLDRSRLRVGGFGYSSLARLKPGVTVADANADIARMLPIWLSAWPTPPNAPRQSFENWRITPVVQPLKDEVVGSVGDMLWILMATIGMVLLIACANVANLMMVRSEGRRQEFAVRTALGARRGDIVREVLVESLALSLVGGGLGVALAYAGLTLVVATAPTTLPRVEDISLDPRVVAFAIVVSLLSSMLFGALPALKHAAQHGAPIVGAARGASTNRERQRTRNALVVVQVALALVLLVASGLMIRTFVALLDVEPGFAAAADVQTARVWVPPQQVPEAEGVTRMQHEILDKVAALPGVKAAAFASAVPMEGPLRVSLSPVFVEGKDYAGTTPPVRRTKTVSPGYFGAIGTRMIAGRDITWSDIYGRTKVAIVSENFAREVWGSPAAALGQRIRDSAPASTDLWREIVGIVEDVHEDALYQAAPAFVYWPVMMENFNGNTLFATRAVNLVIRSDEAGRESLVNGVRNAVSSVNSSMPVFLVRTMKDLYDESMARTSFALIMLAIAAALALALGVIGIYGVIAYVVAQRSREIGIRLALGAAPAQLKRMFVRQGLVLTAVGAGVGLVTAIALTQWMSSLLFGVERLDPATYAAVLGVLATAAAMASYVPARRAAAVDPVETLTAE
jgi:predicted permease